MKRLTYQTVGDAQHPQHYCASYGVKKDDLVQRLGFLEDEIERLQRIFERSTRISQDAAALDNFITEVCSDV